MIIAVCHQKGGAGKTTLATCLGAELERLGFSTLLVDADPQQTACTWRAFAKAENPLPTVLAMSQPNLHEAGQLDRVAENFDFTLIDCPPGIATNPIARSALVASDLMLIPSRPNAADLWALEGLLTLLQQARGINPDVEPLLVLNQMPTNNSKGAHAGARALREMAEDSNIQVLKTVVHQRVDFQNAMLSGSYPGYYNASGKAAKEVKKLVQEVLEACSDD